MNRSTGLNELPAERRLAAILAADVVGYSLLMGQDEVGTLRALKVMRGDVLDPLIASRRGRIVKTTGDGVLAEFSSVVDAVICAVAVQREMLLLPARLPSRTALTLRIGVNIGDIIIDGEDIFGDGVNLAARLESICEPGGVTISRAVHEQVHDKLNLPFVDQGERSVKNIVRPIRVFGLDARAIAAMVEPASSAQLAASPAIMAEDEPEPERPKRKGRKWRVRLILLIIAAVILSRQPGVRHAVENFIALVTTTRDKPQTPTAPAVAKPAELAPLPPPVFVPAAPGAGDKPATPTEASPPAAASPPGPAALPASPAAASPAAPAASPAPASPAPASPADVAKPDAAKPPNEGDQPIGPPLELHPQD
jgi:class 3 adenylate cyclase